VENRLKEEGESFCSQPLVFTNQKNRYIYIMISKKEKKPVEKIFLFF